VPSATYDLFADAMIKRKQISCIYDGYARELCPHILGHTKGREVALAYQCGGQSKSGLPPGGGERRCPLLSEIRHAGCGMALGMPASDLPGHNPASMSST
jgi:hypothetical protein